MSISAVTHPKARSTAKPLDALPNADLLMILTPWSQYRDISPMEISRVLKGKIVIDPFRILDPVKSFQAGLEWKTLGVSPQKRDP